MAKRLLTLIIGNTIASLGISMIIKSGLGCFALTAANLALAGWFNTTVGITGMVLELIMIAIATYKGEGLGITSILNAVYGSLMIDAFNLIVPSHPLMFLGLFILPFGWAMMGKAAFGDTGSNLLMNVLMKMTGKNISLIRGIIEFIFLSIGLLGAREHVTFITLVLTFGLGPLLQIVYKWIRYNPVEIEHEYFIKRKKISSGGIQYENE